MPRSRCSSVCAERPLTRAQYPVPGVGAVNAALGAAANRLTPFYRRFPYRGRLWWTEVDMRTAVCHRSGFLYNRLPKTANSTVTHLLAQQSFGTRAGRAKHRFRRCSRLSTRELRAVVQDYLKFVVVRDPYSRTLSAFLDKVQRRRPQARDPMRWFARAGVAQPAFEDFCRYLDDGGLLADNHWAPQTEGLVLPLDRFDVVARFETLERDLGAIHARLFGAPVAALPRRGPPGVGAEAALARHYTPRAAEIVSRLFREDFERLGYPLRDVTAA